ncbi:AvrD family protein [Leifsonia soli]|uniref:Avirulence D protein (AvrD) n=1 Tax=Leifsonia soli TaxID=582665 RepID=A0A852T4K0_9MICO|nr:AvrD family protein [Leifsonia soli]NYD76117.1 hypothetical protein [Leifsonia soli]
MLMKDAFEVVLGPAEERYFGVGYRRASAQLEDVSVAFPEHAVTVVRATATLRQWERVGASRVAHLGTVDAISIAGTVSSVAMIAAGLSPIGGEGELLSVAVRAGTVPESGMGGIPVEALLAVEDCTDDGLCHVGCRVGMLRVDVVMRAREAHRSRPFASGPVDVETVLGKASGRYFADGFRGFALFATSLDVGLAGGSCDFEIAPADARPGVIECLALTSQLAQAVLYGVAGVPRDRTGNLWMRRCIFSSVPDDVADHQARLTVSKFSRFQRAGVDQVSAVVRISAFPGWRGEASLAFQVHG